MYLNNKDKEILPNLYQHGGSSTHTYSIDNDDWTKAYLNWLVHKKVSRTCYAILLFMVILIIISLIEGWNFTITPVDFVLPALVAFILFSGLFNTLKARRYKKEMDMIKGKQMPGKKKRKNK